jgi:hypothetical protein
VTSIDPEVAAVRAALVLGGLAGLPGLHKAMRRRRRALSMCLDCGRTLLLGERTCDCRAAE